MNSEKLGGNNTNNEKPAWKVEREQEIARKMKIGGMALGVVAAGAIVAGALSHSAKTSEIMSNEEQVKNVKKIEVEGVAFHDGVNARKEPYIDDAESNQLASIGEDGKTVVIDYNGDAYYYDNEDDNKSGWYGFVAAQLSDELSEKGYITTVDANSMKSDEKYGDGVIWCSEDYVSVVEAVETS